MEIKILLVYGYRTHTVNKKKNVKYDDHMVFRLQDTLWYSHAKNKSYRTV